MLERNHRRTALPCLPPLVRGWLCLVFYALPASPLAATEPSLPVPPLADATPPVVAAQPACSPVAECTLWLVSTRGLPDCPPCGACFEPRVCRHDCRAGWVPATSDAFFASDDAGTITVVCIHGNNTPLNDSISDGLQAYRQLCPNCGGTPVRFVIWTWPSDQVIKRRPLQDTQLKAERTSAESYYLARFLHRLRPDVPVSLVGYSFGARIITGGLHLLAGGSLDGRCVGARRNDVSPAYRAVLLAAALDEHWLLPGHEHGLAMSQVDRMVVLVNPLDRVLKLYPWIAEAKGVGALGAVGERKISQLGAQVIPVNVTRQVHRRHDWDSYFRSPQIISIVRRETLFR